MEKLKPCPFCWSDDVAVSDNGAEYGTHEYGTVVFCVSCRAKTSNDFASENHAIAAWNTRPGEDKLRQQRDDLARAIFIVSGLADTKETWCHWCENRRDNHATDCAAAKAESYLQEAK